MSDARDSASAGPPARRRRGKELETALLDAAWEELAAQGYAGLTFDGVATRAGTSRPVVHRRWSRKADLARAAFLHRVRSDPGAVPDTGTLRGDVLALMSGMVERRAELTALVALRFGAYFEETGTSLADLRADMLEGRDSAMEVVLARAVARGEVSANRLAPRVVSLPFDLLRHELLMTLRPPSAEAQAEIVDTLFLPLVGRGPGGQ